MVDNRLTPEQIVAKFPEALHVEDDHVVVNGCPGCNPGPRTLHQAIDAYLDAERPIGSIRPACPDPTDIALGEETEYDIDA